MRKRLIPLIIVDIVLIACCVYLGRNLPGNSTAIGLVFLPPIIIFISAVIGIAMVFFKSPWAEAVLTNVVIATVLLIVLWKYESWKQQHDNYKNFYFTLNNETYSIMMHLNQAEFQDGLTYNIYQRRGDNGNWGTDLDGSYILRNDTLILTSAKGKVMKIFNKTLFGHPQSNSLTPLRSNP